MKAILKKGLHKTPSEGAKNKIFRLLLNSRGMIWRELIIPKGSSAVMVGTPNQHRVRQFAELTGNNGEALFIEPEPDNFASLKTVAEEYGHVTVDNRGAWSESGTQELLLGDESNPGDHKIPVEGVEHDNDYRPENYNQSMEVKVDPLDTIINEQEIIPDYIEIMVNGAEFEILKGAKKTLKRAGPKLLVKGHQRDMSTGEPMNKQIAEYLHGYGYETSIGASTTQTVGETGEWETRAGDVYAWK